MYRHWHRLFLLWAAASAGAQQTLKVDLVYPAPNGSTFDRACSQITKNHIEPKEVSEVLERLPEFQALWDKNGREYLSTALREVGADYPFQEVQATLTVCPGVSSMGSPLMIQVEGFLASTGEKPRPATLFPMYLFHELMHLYVNPIRIAGSPLRKKYAAETVATLNFLHVVALEKFVLVTLGYSDILKAWEELNRTERSPAHKRAWEIVQAESYEPFIDELKLLRKQPNVSAPVPKL
jgi:hypothetical protein